MFNSVACGCTRDFIRGLDRPRPGVVVGLLGIPNVLVNRRSEFSPREDRTWEETVSVFLFANLKLRSSCVEILISSNAKSRISIAWGICGWKMGDGGDGYLSLCDALHVWFLAECFLCRGMSVVVIDSRGA